MSCCSQPSTSLLFSPSRPLSTWTLQDTPMARIPRHYTCIMHNIATILTQSTAADWLRAYQERQPKTIIHCHPVQRPVTAIALTSLSCVPRLEYTKGITALCHTYIYQSPSTQQANGQQRQRSLYMTGYSTITSLQQRTDCGRARNRHI
jgi:hypothetical protein